jgi:heme/copper-type cytochrome/quinol oxidase subunit 2
MASKPLFIQQVRTFGAQYVERCMLSSRGSWYKTKPTYEMSDFNSCSETHNLKYSSYMLTNEFLKENYFMGFFRNLETNKRVVLPTNTHLRLLITAVDVLHSWTIPSFGVKVGASIWRYMEILLCKIIQQQTSWRL